MLAVSALVTGPGWPQTYPAKPIRIIVPTPPGGANDTLTRHLAQVVSGNLGQPVITENRAGGGSMIGMLALAKSPPDGYTLAITTAEPVIYNPFLYKELPYDADRDFSYVSQLVRTNGMIVASPQSKGETFPEVIAYAKANPGKLNFATWGAGSTPSIFLDWIKLTNGVDIVAVPYKGAGPAVPSTISGETQLTYAPMLLGVPLVKGGKLKAIAVAGTQPSPLMPNVPTLSSYNSDPLISGGFSAYAPAGVPLPILNRLSAELVKALNTPQLQQFAHEGACTWWAVRLRSLRSRSRSTKQMRSAYSRRCAYP